MTQPTALYLADVIANDPCSKAHHDAAAAELRRLYDDYENALKHFAEAIDGYKQMAAQRDELLEELDSLVKLTARICEYSYGDDMDNAFLRAREAVAKAQQ